MATDEQCSNFVNMASQMDIIFADRPDGLTVWTAIRTETQAEFEMTCNRDDQVGIVETDRERFVKAVHYCTISLGRLRAARALANLGPGEPNPAIYYAHLFMSDERYRQTTAYQAQLAAYQAVESVQEPH